jgi:DNA-binding response OmpR family regulator
MKLLVIEDDKKIVTAITFSCQLGWPGVEIISAAWGQEGVDLVGTANPDLVVLDLGLPDIDGLEVLKRIRMFSRVPVLILTVNTDEATVVQALQLGANDYVNKPFRQMELIARIKRLALERLETEGSSPIVFGTFTYDYARRNLNYKGKALNLRCIENEMLNKLIRESPHIVTYSSLAKSVWGEDYTGAVDSLKVHLRHLREKIEEDPSNPKIILTKIGVGYYLIKPS